MYELQHVTEETSEKKAEKISADRKNGAIAEALRRSSQLRLECQTMRHM